MTLQGSVVIFSPANCHQLPRRKPTAHSHCTDLKYFRSVSVSFGRGYSYFPKCIAKRTMENNHDKQMINQNFQELMTPQKKKMPTYLTIFNNCWRSNPLYYWSVGIMHSSQCFWKHKSHVPVTTNQLYNTWPIPHMLHSAGIFINIGTKNHPIMYTRFWWLRTWGRPKTDKKNMDDLGLVIFWMFLLRDLGFFFFGLLVALNADDLGLGSFFLA